TRSFARGRSIDSPRAARSSRAFWANAAEAMSEVGEAAIARSSRDGDARRGAGALGLGTGRLRVLRDVFALTGTRERVVLGCVVALGMIMRIAVVAVVQFAFRDRVMAIGVSLILGVVFAAQSALVTMLRARIETALSTRAIDALLARDPG